MKLNQCILWKEIEFEGKILHIGVPEYPNFKNIGYSTTVGHIPEGSGIESGTLGHKSSLKT